MIARPEERQVRRELEVLPAFVQHDPTTARAAARRGQGTRARPPSAPPTSARLTCHDDDRDQIREHVPEDDARGRRADGAGRLDEGERLEAQHRPADDAREDRRVHDGDGDHDVAHIRPERRDDAEREEYRGEGEEYVHHAADDEVGRAARVAGEEAERPAGDRRQRDRDERDLHREPGPEEDAAQEVPAERVGPEREVRGSDRRGGRTS